jgi:hypothetical protein
MLSGKEELAGGYRLASIRKTKKYLYIAEILVLIAAPIFVVLAAGLVTLTPFYLPINSFIYFILVMLLIIMIEGFVFKVLEMRLIKSNSTKYYITKVAIRRAVMILIIAVIVVVLLWTPFINTAIQGALSTDGTLENDHSYAASSAVAFYDRDALGLSAVNQIVIHANGGQARVYLVSEQNYERFKNNVSQMIPYRINTNDYLANQDLTIELTNMPNGQYYLVLDTVRSTSASVDYSIQSSISSTFLSYVPFFALLFAVANAAWLGYLIPLQKKYSGGAIYR